MKGKTVFVALVMSVALCSQGFGFELLDRMLGLNCGGCGGCAGCCEPACCEAPKACAPEPACCEKPAAVCEPAACEPACCEPAACGKPCGCKKRFRPVRDLFDGLECMLDCKPCCKPACCEAPKACAPEPACCDPCAKPKRCCKPKRCRPKACKPQCCEPAAACCEPAAACCEPAACKPACGKSCCKPRCRPVLDLLDDLFCCKKSCRKSSCCEPACCEPAACGGCGGGEQAAPAVAPAEEAAPLPKAPDPTASMLRARSIYQVSRSIDH